MDVKEQIKKVVDRITKDENLQEQFQKEPEGILGVDLPDDVINQVVQGVKAKLTADKVSDTVDALKGFLK